MFHAVIVRYNDIYIGEGGSDPLYLPSQCGNKEVSQPESEKVLELQLVTAFGLDHDPVGPVVEYEDSVLVELAVNRKGRGILEAAV